MDTNTLSSGIHEFWGPDKELIEKRLRRAVDLREQIKAMPATKQTFKLSQIGYHPKEIPQELVVLVGSWQLPDLYAPEGSHSAPQYVNPTYEHTHTLPASYAECECGAHMSHGKANHAGNLESEHDHTDDCPSIDRLRARVELLERRREILIEGLLLGQTGCDLSSRLGIKTAAIGAVTNTLGVEIRPLRQTFRSVAGRTYVHFKSLGISVDLFGKAYGVNPETPGKWAKNYTECEFRTSNQEWVLPETTVPKGVGNAD